MARAPDQRIEQAKELYEKGLKLIDISKQLGVPEGTVRRWKCTHKWDSERSDKKSERSERKKGGQPGNKNAAGGPPGNKKAEKYGFFSKYLPDETKEIFDAIEHADPLDLLWHQIQIAYAAIVRAQRIAYVKDHQDRTINKIGEKDGETVLKLLSESGESSWELLQNCYPIKAYTEQKISVALALTDLFLEKLGKGICRIHGGGFAGVIMCVVPEEETENYVSYISEFAGKENVYPMNIRAVGAVHIEK